MLTGKKTRWAIAWGRTEGVVGDNRVVHGMRTDGGPLLPAGPGFTVKRPIRKQYLGTTLPDLLLDFTAG